MRAVQRPKYLRMQHHIASKAAFNHVHQEHLAPSSAVFVLCRSLGTRKASSTLGTYMQSEWSFHSVFVHLRLRQFESIACRQSN